MTENESDSKKITVTYQFETFTRECKVNKFGTLREIRKVLEKQINLSLKQMNMIYRNNNILNVPEKTKIYDYFGEVSEIQIELRYKDFVEDDYKLVFEKAFTNAGSPAINVGERKMRHLKSLKNNESQVPVMKDRKVCNYDLLNEAKYICLKCSQLWCEHCLKFEVHKTEISPLDQLDNTLRHKRQICMKNLEDKITNDPYFGKLEKIDFILNEKVSVIDKQFNELINLINRIKENQMKFIIDYYYTKISDKKYTSLFKDTKFFRKTMKDIDIAYKSDQVDLNLKNMRTMEDGLYILIQKFEEFKNKYGDFDRLFLQFHGFNQTFISQIEAKMDQNTQVGKSLENPEELDKLNDIKTNFETIVKNKNRGTSLIKIKYYNSIMIWNHLNQKLIRVSDFVDNCEFKLNYQVFAGNIFLNLQNKLFIVTGSNFNMFFFYDPIKNQVYRLPSLKDNHCRGGLIYVKYFNAILCISGKYTKKVEVFKLDEFNLNNYNDDGQYNGQKFHNKGDNIYIKSPTNDKPTPSRHTSHHSHHSHHSKDKDKEKSKSGFSASRKDSKNVSKDHHSHHSHSHSHHSHSNSKDDKSDHSHSHSHSKSKSNSNSADRDNSLDKNDFIDDSNKNTTSNKKDSKHSKSHHSKDNSHNSTHHHKSKNSEDNKNDVQSIIEKRNADKINYMYEGSLIWEDFPELNYARNYACFYTHNDYYLYVFFGYNQYRGNLESVEKIDLREPKAKWEIIKYQNPNKLDLHIASMSVCYASADEIYILGGSIRDEPTDQILKYNFKQNAFFKTEMSIPGIRENEYYRFWEESSFIPLTSKGNATNADDEFTFGLIDARDKVHLYNIRNFKYNII